MLEGTPNTVAPPLPTNSAPASTSISGNTQDNAALVLDKAAKVKRMLYFRRQLDTRRAYFYRQYVSQRDAPKYPDGITSRANVFAPYAYSNVETVVTRTQDALFGMDGWFEVRPRSITSSEAAEKMQMVLEYMLHRSRFIPAFEILIRNIAIYGHGGIKIDWDYEYETINYPDPIYAPPQPVVDQFGQMQLDPNTGQPQMAPPTDPRTGQPLITGYKVATKQIPRACPKFIPIDAYDLLVDPDGTMKAQLTEKSWGQMRREQQQSLAAQQADTSGTVKPLYDPQGFATLQSRIEYGATDAENTDEVIVRLAELWDRTDNSWTIMVDGQDAQDSLSFKDLRGSYRGLNYSSYKRKAYGGEAILLYHDSNPFDHKRCPILDTAYVKLPNEPFGVGVIEPTSDLNESLNKFLSMITDNWNLGINHRYAYDINADIDHQALNNMNVPGGKVAVSGDPSKVIFPLPQYTPAPGDYAILDIFKGQIELASGVSDFYSKGMGGPSGNQTATGISQVMAESNYRFKMFIRNLELDILQPALEIVASLVQQFCTDQIEVEITGEPPAIPKKPGPNPPPSQTISAAEIIGNYGFDILGANYMQNPMMLQRNIMALANILGPSPYINQYESIREILKIFKIPRIDRLLKSEQQVEMEQQQQMMMQMQMAASQGQQQGQGGEGGRPAKMQFEGQIPGGGATAGAHATGQSMGATSFGLGGLGEVPNAG